MAVLVASIVVVYFGILSGYGFVKEITGSSREGVENLAIFFGFLTGFGVVMFFSGISLVLIDRAVTHVILVPWYALMIAGFLVSASMAVFAFYSRYTEYASIGIESKGLGMIFALGLAFMASGWRQKKAQDRSTL
ncbi:hypothetical protein [Aquisalimonas asiatica]|uniref:hypothetical protein n=1 Tax=Aquisalimonas asiatica TaxID=406100 RepID=UPI000B806AC1|nr:hypothetical protein [Aquisalimonas asiatica]